MLLPNYIQMLLELIEIKIGLFGLKTSSGQ